MECNLTHFVGIGLVCFAFGILAGFWAMLTMLGEEGTKLRNHHAKEKGELEAKVSQLGIELRLSKRSEEIGERKISELENKIRDVLDILDPEDDDTRDDEEEDE